MKNTNPSLWGLRASTVALCLALLVFSCDQENQDNAVIPTADVELSKYYAFLEEASGVDRADMNYNKAADNFTVNKDIPVSESLGKFQLRFEFFNFFNRAKFDNPNASLASPAQIGKITSAGPGRIVQFGAKYVF